MPKLDEPPSDRLSYDARSKDCNPHLASPSNETPLQSWSGREVLGAREGIRMIPCAFV
jgi:hypothetical protein